MAEKYPNTNIGAERWKQAVLSNNINQSKTQSDNQIMKTQMHGGFSAITPHQLLLLVLVIKSDHLIYYYSYYSSW